jgi:predicted DCC family thiol-disulfide oxidoreductase YuxK
VNFVIDNDKKDTFRFAALQSEKGQTLLQQFKLNTSDFDTFVLIVKDKHFTKSTAALKITKELNSFVRILYPFIFFPQQIRDFLYDLIAKSRYKLFGKKDICRIPTENERKKFLE